MSNENDDVEAILLTVLDEVKEQRWAYIRKVYSMLTIQILVIIGFAAIVVSVHPIANFFRNTWAGWAVYALILIVPFFVSCLIICCGFLIVNRENHPLYLVLAGILTLSIGLAIGLVSAFVDGKIIIEAGVATSAVLISLILCTFWAAKRDHDFSFLGLFLLSLVVIAFTFAIIQIFFPMGKISQMLYSGAFAIVFSAYVIFKTPKSDRAAYISSIVNLGFGVALRRHLHPVS